MYLDYCDTFKNKYMYTCNQHFTLIILDIILLTMILLHTVLFHQNF